MHAVHAIAELVVEVDVLAAVVEGAEPVADDVRDAGIFGGEDVGVRRDDEVAVRRDADVGEGVLDAGREAPAVEAHGGCAFVVQLDVFLEHVLGRGVIHDFRNHDTGGVRIERVGPCAAVEAIAGHVEDSVARSPGDSDVAEWWLREAEDVRAGTRAGEGGGGREVDEQVGSVHAGDGFAEEKGDGRERGETGAGRRIDAGDGRSGGVEQQVGPGRARAVVVEGGGRREEIRDAVRGGPGDRDRAIRGLREREDVIAARAGDAGGGDVVDEQVGGVHAGDVFAEGDGDLREVGEVAGRRHFREDDRSGGVRADGDVHGGGGGGEAGVVARDSGERVAAGGKARDVEAVGAGRVISELGGVRVEGDVGHRAVAVGRGCCDGEAGGRTVEIIVRRRGEGDERREIRRGGEDSVELGFHGDVGAGERALVNFDGEDVVPGDERGEGGGG